jgi:hypothetical protein
MNRAAMNDDAIESLEAETIRIGSPFAIDPAVPFQTAKQIEAFYDVSPLRYTAMGAVAASCLVLCFGAAAAWWFPSGGVLIAALGCGLSLFGMASVYRYSSIGLLMIHLGLFLFSYSRTVGIG